MSDHSIITLCHLFQSWLCWSTWMTWSSNFTSNEIFRFPLYLIHPVRRMPASQWTNGFEQAVGASVSTQHDGLINNHLCLSLLAMTIDYSHAAQVEGLNHCPTDYHCCRCQSASHLWLKERHTVHNTSKQGSGVKCLNMGHSKTVAQRIYPMSIFQRPSKLYKKNRKFHAFASGYRCLWPADRPGVPSSCAEWLGGWYRCPSKCLLSVNSYRIWPHTCSPWMPCHTCLYSW
jgi:hypothetical protein